MLAPCLVDANGYSSHATFLSFGTPATTLSGGLVHLLEVVLVVVDREEILWLRLIDVRPASLNGSALVRGELQAFELSPIDVRFLLVHLDERPAAQACPVSVDRLAHGSLDGGLRGRVLGVGPVVAGSLRRGGARRR